jgi:GNAT superfamily N-acetyltransferase
MSEAWSPEDRSDLLYRVMEQVRRCLSLVADEMEPIGPGWVVRTRSLPWVWSVNQLRITEPISFREVVALADEHRAGLPHRHVLVEHEATADRLEDPFVSAGWSVERDLLMVLAGPPDRVADTSAITELTEDQMLNLMGRWITEERPAISAVALDQVRERNRREGNALGELHLGMAGPADAPLAVTKLRVDGTTAWVEDVYTAPEARGRGYARALVTHAVALAASGGSELTFIIADDDDWPKSLYLRIGFSPVGRNRAFHLDVGTAS